ncbi:MAG: 30S ribosomal protein S15 [Candidatus Nitrosocaldaceae archaeon]
MARTHAHKKGKSHSTRPVNPDLSWVRLGKDEIVSLITKMGREGLTSSEIGVKLRDEYAVPLAKPLIGRSISDVLKANNIKRELPEDLSNLLNKALRLQHHLKQNPGDSNNIRSLELIEAKIHRLSKYYKREGILPSKWKYAAAIAQLE